MYVIQLQYLQLIGPTLTHIKKFDDFKLYIYDDIGSTFIHSLYWAKNAQ